MDRLAIEIGVAIVVFAIGYWMGFHACYEYLMEELKNHNSGAYYLLHRNKYDNK